ncbi:hypothetical protein SPRG_15846 [Saprolegnia parasitica CBS 223.65]|uniref:Uncharacterized protein n=1 Tax=Saprolegnia parasitica (strain CBS 223.65) TaxID=695850 RepID=A0A067BKA1_SAPPC|nr:hypothetical protein SPRG_15846 [Saprolegnia parasitica CBS 223.65]KDO18894.1 hypothetical protein SPRG_15846 [Saprolegnia parasitica CBS 223.65]|eukprot:XP_012210415.1 hypothetical protein SPRG_15846 [Saprolegnia parasitica CBS 223.65]
MISNTARAFLEEPCDPVLYDLRASIAHGFTHHEATFADPELSVDGLDELLTWPRPSYPLHATTWGKAGLKLMHLVIQAAGSTDTSFLQPTNVDDGTFARLVVLLPSHCVGGIISLTYHDEDEVWSVATAARPPTDLSFAAAASYL